MAGREPLAVAVLAPWLLFPDLSRSLTIIALAALPLLWAVRSLAGRPVCWPTPLNRPLLIVLLMLGPAVWASPLPDLSLAHATVFLLGLALYFALVNCDPQWRRLEVGAMVMAAGAALTAVLALIGTDWGWRRMGMVGDAASWLASSGGGTPAGDWRPAVVAGALAMLLPVVFALALYARQRGRQPMMSHWQALTWSALIVAALMLAVIVIARSRVAIALVVLAAGIAGSLRWRWVGVVMAALALAAAALLGIGLFSGNLSQWMVTLDALSRPAGVEPTAWLQRLEIWRNALLVMRDYPLVGVGLHAFGAVARVNYPFEALPAGQPLHHAHNLWLQAAADWGWLGMAAFAWLTVALVLMGWAMRRRRYNGEQVLLGGMWFGAIVWLGHGWLHAIPLGNKPALFIWGTLGLMVGSWINREPEAVAPADARRRRWVLAARGGLVAVLLVLLVTWLLDSPIWHLNHGGNLLDRVLLAEPGRVPVAGNLNGSGRDLAVAQQALQGADDLSGVARRRALIQYWTGNRDQAIALFRSDPGAEAYLVSLGRLLLEAGALDAAGDLAYLGREVLPDSGPFTCLAADVWRAHGDLFRALEFYQLVPERAESFGEPGGRLAVCTFQLGLTQKELGWWSEATNSFGTAVELDPQELAYQAEYGWALYQSTGEVTRAVAVEEAILKTSPDSASVVFIITDMYLDSGRLQKGLEWAQQLVAIAPQDSTAWLRLAQAHWALEQPGDARRALDEALRLEPENRSALALQIAWTGL